VLGEFLERTYRLIALPVGDGDAQVVIARRLNAEETRMLLRKLQDGLGVVVIVFVRSGVLR
jgi:hypothetical protein